MIALQLADLTCYFFFLLCSIFIWHTCTPFLAFGVSELAAFPFCKNFWGFLFSFLFFFFFASYSRLTYLTAYPPCCQFFLSRYCRLFLSHCVLLLTSFIMS